MDIHNLIDRKQKIRTLPEPPAHVKQRIAQAAQELNKAGDMAIHVELANEALTRFTVMLYQKDDDGLLANVDTHTYRIMRPAPWGNAGWRYWGLRYWEAAALRKVLMARLTQPRHVVLFDYNTDIRSWFLNLVAYADLSKGQAYLQHCPVTLAEWRKAIA